MNKRLFLKILFSSAGRRNALMNCFREAARGVGVGVRLLAADMNPDLSPACQRAAAAFAVPRCTDAAFVPAILEICRREEVSLIVPTIDTELAVFAEPQNREQFEQLGVRVAVGSPATIALARDKMAFHQFLKANEIPTPRTFEAMAWSEVAPAFAAGTPLIFKPRDGSRSIGIWRGVAGEEPPAAVINERYIFQERLIGREFTVAFYVGRDGRCRCVVPYERLEVRDGEIAKGITRRLPALENAVQKMAERLPAAYGAHCTQAIVCDDGSFGLFELNARFGGGYPLVDDAGASFAQWLIEDTGNLPSSVHNDWSAERKMLRYDAAVFC